MKLEKLAGSEVAFEILKEGQEYKTLRESILSKFKNVKVDGFRKGHVPADVIEKTFKTEIRDELINEVLKTEYTALIREEKLRPVADLQIVSLDYDEEKLKMSLKVAVFPEFELPKYKGLDIKTEEVTVTDEEVENEINNMVKRAKRFEKTEREVAQNGDIAVINFEGFVDGVAFDGGKAENHRLELGSKTFIDTFEEQIIGKKLGEEFDVNVKFPEEYHAENLKGKEAVFKVKLNELEEPKTPELNDDFAKSAGSDSLEDLRKAIKGNILSNKENQATNKRLQTIVETITDATTMEVPAITVDQEINAQIDRFAQTLQMQGMNLEAYLQMTEQTVDKMREDLREKAEKGVKSSFILSKIAETEAIEVTEAEFDAELERVAGMYGMTVDQLTVELQKTDGVNRFFGQINSQLFFAKVNEFLLSNN
ncbi:trigger factor [Streptobacillus felis]|uniref:Trigger factor n=1 Tax=Streptobacillus felis TaxID=1384509 RepID=A0A7Z0PEP0_9FUSO|nr:trigger factor [Streptobacillus felis]NYV27376.1 trigger factor [Streptobacillus felis]